MHYLALYRKYRPETLDDVVGQDNVVRVIKNEISNDRISHAYLFAGPRGTGKTTIAKIIAKMVNCEKLVDGNCCNKCFNCLNFKNNNDIVEIDAASNNGVDEIRELRDKINFVPNNSKYKVYIIDEVHMLTTQAFNALLKTLEEPPLHVIFILATTELHKVPLTVASRCQKFQFSKITNADIVLRLKKILELEGRNVNDDVLNEIARLADGGMRDAINMLDQLIAYSGDNVLLKDVYELGGYVSYVDLYNFINYVISNNVVEIVKFIEKIDNDGKNISKFINELLVFLKDILLKKSADIDLDIVEKKEKIYELSMKLDDNLIYNMIKVYNDMLSSIRTSSNYVMLFIINTLKIINENLNVEKENEKLEKVSISNDAVDKSILKDTIINNEVTKEIQDRINVRINNTFVYANKKDLTNLKEQWEKIGEYLFDNRYANDCGILKDCSVVAVGNNYVILTSKYIATVDKINCMCEQLENTINAIFNKRYNIVALDEKKWEDEKKQYALNIKQGKKYKFIDEIEIKNKNRSPVDELIDIIGEELVEIK